MKRLLAYLFIVLGFGLTSSVNANSNKPIIIPTHNWSSQIVGAYVIGGIFESIGKNIKYKNHDSQAVYESIRRGDVSISHEVWESAFGRSFNNALSKGGIIDAGLHPAPTMEDIGVPTWVIEKNLCPGLPNWEALKNCADVFARPGSKGKGIILEGPQSWHGDLIPQRIDALGLGKKYKVKFASSADQLWKELYDAKRKGKGILMFNWSPNFTDAEGFTMIKWPKYYPGCRPADGGSGACGSPSGYLKKAASDKFAKMHPDAFNVFKKISFTTKDMGKMAYYVDVEKMTHQDAAKKWLRKNKYKWEYWIGKTNIAYNAFDQQKIEEDSFYETTTKLVKKQEEKNKIQKNNELNITIDKIERLFPGDYYLFAHSTSGEKFWGSTKAKSKTTQIGNAFSSSGRSCKLTSKQKTKKVPYKGAFKLNCPSESIKGSWTQENGYSPGIGQAFTDSGDIITAFFSNKQSVVINFAEKYFDKKQIEIAQKKELPKEFRPKSENLDKNPPKINIASAITVNDTDYEIEGFVKDESEKIYIEAEGRPIKVKDGKFIIRRFSPIDEEISIVAIDQWGNRSKPKLVKISINLKDTDIVEKLEPLNPSILDNKISEDTVALIIGIEKYKNSPDATFANLDAKYFFEYAKKGFGIKQNNIKLLLDENASLIDSISTLEKWLPAKIKTNKTNLIVFFAGHGLASNDGKELYLLPQDSDPDLLSRTALSRTELFTTILRFKPKSVTMFFDACYSGQSRDEKTLLASARPIRVVADEKDGIPNNFTIFSASQMDQISSGLKEANHGIFSYFLMKGLEGNADTNKDKKITNGELLAYMNENVSQKAAELGRQQNPSLAGDPNKVLMSYR